MFFYNLFLLLRFFFYSEEDEDDDDDDDDNEVFEACFLWFFNCLKEWGLYVYNIDKY
jgi:hypothetical protein